MSDGKKCINYIGMTCVIAGCPVLVDMKETGRDSTYKRHCENCILNAGCDDCYYTDESGCQLERGTLATDENPTATENCDNKEEK